jgi:hypothetical protein
MPSVASRHDGYGWRSGWRGAALFARIACPRFDGFIRNSEVESVSIIFATGFLGNPASYYGHALLKFNYTGTDSRSPLLDVSVNYGAILTGTDDPLTYMLKGVFGGYDGGFSHVHYYFHNHNYGENELRDLWEYRLDLPPEAVRLIVAHAWEVLGQRYTYYFFRRNCAFRMAEIVQVVDGVDITPPKPAMDHSPVDDPAPSPGKVCGSAPCCRRCATTRLVSPASTRSTAALRVRMRICLARWQTVPKRFQAHAFRGVQWHPARLCSMV